MKQTRNELPLDGIYSLVGSGVVLSLIVSLALVAAGGWGWFLNFLSDGAAAWVEAIGSIAAIAAALTAIRIQHRQLIERDAEAERQLKRGRLKSISALLHSVALLSLECGGKVGSGTAVWIIERRRLENSRAMLTGIPIMDLPDVLVVHIFSDVLERLHVAIRMVEDLENFGDDRHSDDRRQKVRMIIQSVADSCSIGIYELTGMVARLSTAEELANGDASYLPDREEATARARELFEKARKEHSN